MATKKKDKAAASTGATGTAESQAAGNAKKSPGMRIIAMQVENTKKISFMRVRPKGDVVVVSGDNGSGKSSALDSIDYALCGVGNVPSAPIKTGQRVSRIQVEIGVGRVVHYQIERTFTKVENGKTPFLSKLFVSQLMEGEMIQRDSPQRILDNLMGAISFDPLEFIRMADKDQLTTLRGLVKFKVDIDQLDAEKEVAYSQRRDAGRDFESVKARFVPMMAPDPKLPKEPIDVAALQQKMLDAAEHNGAIERAKARKEQLEDQMRLEDRKVIALRADALRILAEATAIDGKTWKIDSELFAVSKKEAPVYDPAGVGWKQENLQKEIDAIEIGTPIDTAAVSDELTKAQTLNFAIQSRDLYNSVMKEYEAAETEWKRLDELVKSKDVERAAAIAEAKMPIEGLSIGAGEVLYKELPFNQASNAEQIRVSVALAIACNPTLRVLRIKDGSLLDENSMEMIRTMATEADYQVWIERVSGDGQVGIVMVDGEATGDETEKEA